MMSQTGKDESLQKKLRALESQFADRLADRLQQLDFALGKWLSEPQNSEHPRSLHRLLHTLAGLAGTFGFVELGQRARMLEEALDLPHPDPLLFAEKLKEFLHWAAANSKRAKSAPAPAPQSVEPGAEPPPVALVYLVSNNALVARDLAAQITYFGYEVVLVAKPEDLAAAVSERVPVALVMDLGFENGMLLGIEEIARIRRISGRRIPTIVLSTRGNFATRLAAVRAGADGYFIKPADVPALCDRLDILTARREIMPHRILIVDDDPTTAEYYAAVLRGAGMEVSILQQLNEILRVLGEYRPELILMDVYMPDYSGIELSKLVRQDNTYLDVPIVFLSSEGDLARELDAIESGADDFITKPIDANHLASSISTRAARYRALRGLIMRDGLTGLSNHSAIKEQLVREISRADRSHAPLTLAMIDLDFFKRVNDTYGHQVGDQVLRALSRLLQQRLRRSDMVGRYGGEEFVVILPGTPAAAALILLNKVREAFSKVRHHAEDLEFTLTFSAGIAELDDHTDGDALFKAADAALYRAKKLGRDRVEVDHKE